MTGAAHQEPSPSRLAARRAVVWDIGRVLYQWDLRFLYAKLIADRAQLDWFLSHVATETWHFESDAGRPVAAMLAERKALFPRYASLLDCYEERFLETLPAPVPGTHALVERLAQRGIAQYALSNFSAEHWARFRPTAPVFAHFAACVISGEERAVKPHPRIFQVLEERAGLAGEALFFIDDRADNIAAATARGWRGHRFVDAGALQQALVEERLL